MSEGSGSGEDVDREDGSDEDQFEEAANQIADGAAGQAAQAASALALPEWAADLLARLAAGDRLDARDQPRLQLALDLRREHAAAVHAPFPSLAPSATTLALENDARAPPPDAPRLARRSPRLRAQPS